MIEGKEGASVTGRVAFSGTPPVVKLREALASAGWQQALRTLPGYGPDRPGQVLSLTRELPWWAFRVRKRGQSRR